MASPSQKLAQSLERLQALQRDGQVAIRSSDLSRTHRERLVSSGFLVEVLKGWYLPANPDETRGSSTTWYTSFWGFCADYLDTRLGAEWCVSPEQSLSLHAGNRTVPRQLVVRSPGARNRATRLIHDTSVLDGRATLPPPQDRVEIDGLRIFDVPAALIACSPTAFRANPNDTRAALATLPDASPLLQRLLDGGHSTIAGRLAGALRNIGRGDVAGDVVATMKAAGYVVREQDPFVDCPPTVLRARESSPYANRVRLVWQQIRDVAIERFPRAPGGPIDVEAYLRDVEDVYVDDAYNSLSIEGYQISPELIERVRTGGWEPDSNPSDREHGEALAARGYWQAFQAVRQSLQRILRGENPGVVAREDHSTWFRELFAPNVRVGLLRPSDLAGYRGEQVYIRNSRHVPLRPSAVRDVMPTLFDLLEEEPESAARAVLGHFVFVYIHPYIDGNGRLGRLLMNTMLASGGYPWIVVPVDARGRYMAALERASVHEDIEPFAGFLAQLVDETSARLKRP